MKTNTTRFLLAIGGLGGLLYGIDFGVIAVSMPYIKALGIYTDAQVSWIVGAVMFGGILASASAGLLCDGLGRKKMIAVAAALFLVQRSDAARFSPNRETDNAFAEALCAARDAGVDVWCYDCNVTADTIAARSEVPAEL